ncbi:coiled-coil domain-containing protein [Nonomuraea sp. NPDC048826]|uniref:coiled-coil domain-containing protein n=1 Tax=Nonomuraea sp. NPDC048826 TaxID=3364347 RepID=UPI00371E2647
MAVASPAGRRRASLRVLGTTVLTTVLCAALTPALPPSALADPKPTVKQLEKELADLQKESDKLIEDYYHGRRDQQQAEKAEKAASEKLAEAQAVFDRQATELRAMAVSQYMNGGSENMALLTGIEDRGVQIRRLALTQHLIDEQQATLAGFAQVRDRHRQAQQEAEARRDELAASVQDLDGRRKKAERTIGKIRDKIDQLHEVPGRRSDGTFVPQLPDGADNITPRMRLVRNLIEKRFGTGPGIGCYRPIQDGGQHPLGRACDFMLSRGGAFPSPAEVQRGHEIAAWAIKNARRFGIMYIIYRQRIWHVRTGAWRVMTDRGGTTANHYDHPHISVY